MNCEYKTWIRISLETLNNSEMVHESTWSSLAEGFERVSADFKLTVKDCGFVGPCDRMLVTVDNAVAITISPAAEAYNDAYKLMLQHDGQLTD